MTLRSRLRSAQPAHPVLRLHRLRIRRRLLLLAALIAVAGCTPSAEQNVLAYLLAQRLGTLASDPPPGGPAGALSGVVLHGEQPIHGASVVVAGRYGTPHAAQTGPDGRYRIEGVPPGQYTPAAIAPGYREAVPRDLFGIPRLVTIEAGRTAQAPPIELAPHIAQPLPAPLAEQVNLTRTGIDVVSAPFPIGAAAQVERFAFTYAGATVDTLRLYLPLDGPPNERLPMLFLVYPSHSDNWEPVSVAFAAEGYAVVAVSPITERGMDIDAHAQDSRIAFALAQNGDLDPRIAPGLAVALGGSFSSPILHRFLRDEREGVAAWITLGGISDAFSATADFYAKRLEVPPQYSLAIPALGLPNLYPLPFLRYSPVYAAAELPPTMVIHTAADRITPIDQAFRLERALIEAGVPVEVFYYEDVSHYLQIGADLTDTGAEMYYRILDFIAQYLTSPHAAAVVDYR